MEEANKNNVLSVELKQELQTWLETEAARNVRTLEQQLEFVLTRMKQGQETRRLHAQLRKAKREAWRAKWEQREQVA